MCCNSGIDAPLGIPSGSVRSIIALIIIPTIIALSGAGMIILFIQKNNEGALSILAGLMGILGTVVGYYFASRSSASATKAIEKMSHENLENMKLEIGKIGDLKTTILSRLPNSNNHSNDNNHIRINMDDDTNDVEEINSGLLS